MSDAVTILTAAAVNALQVHPVLSQRLLGVFDGPPVRAAYPYISVANGLVTDWSTKTETGREIRFSLTVWDDGEEAGRLHALVNHAGEAIAAMPDNLDDWRIASCTFLRSMIVRDAAGPWAGLLEYRFRMLQF